MPKPSANATAAGPSESLEQRQVEWSDREKTDESNEKDTKEKNPKIANKGQNSEKKRSIDEDSRGSRKKEKKEKTEKHNSSYGIVIWGVEGEENYRTKASAIQAKKDILRKQPTLQPADVIIVDHNKALDFAFDD
jgi:hypothetical protein